MWKKLLFTVAECVLVGTVWGIADGYDPAFASPEFYALITLVGIVVTCALALLLALPIFLLARHAIKATQAAVASQNLLFPAIQFGLLGLLVFLLPTPLDWILPPVPLLFALSQAWPAFLVKTGRAEPIRARQIALRVAVIAATLTYPVAFSVASRQALDSAKSKALASTEGGPCVPSLKIQPRADRQPSSQFRSEPIEVQFYRGYAHGVFEGTRMCTYGSQAPITLRAQIPAGDDCVLDRARASLACGSTQHNCPDAHWEVAQFESSFPRNQGWWHTPQIHRPVRAVWNPNEREFVCVYEERSRTAAIQKYRE